MVGRPAEKAVLAVVLRKALANQAARAPRDPAVLPLAQQPGPKSEIRLSRPRQRAIPSNPTFAAHRPANQHQPSARIDFTLRGVTVPSPSQRKQVKLNPHVKDRTAHTQCRAGLPTRVPTPQPGSLTMNMKVVRMKQRQFSRDLRLVYMGRLVQEMDRVQTM